MPQIPPIAVNNGRGAHQANPVLPYNPRLNQAPQPNQEALFDEDVFLPTTQPDRVQLVPRPAIEMASSVDVSELDAITTASQFQSWLFEQVLLWKDYLRAEPDHKREFFENAREAMTKTSMNPDERAKAVNAFKQAENLLDR